MITSTNTYVQPDANSFPSVKSHKELYSTNCEYCPELNERLCLLYQGGFAIREKASMFLEQLHGLENDKAYKSRLKSIAYIPYLSEFITQFGASLFSESLEVHGPGDENDSSTLGETLSDFYKDFLGSCDLDGRSLHQFMQDVFEQGLSQLKVYVGMDFPNTGVDPVNKQQEELLGTNKGYVFTIPYDNVIDWKRNPQTNKFVWTKEFEECTIDDDPLTVPKHYYQFRIRKMVNGQACCEIWKSEVMDIKKKYNQTTKYTLESITSTSFPEIPLWDFCIPKGYHVGQQIGSLCQEHYQRRSFMVANANKTCVGLGVVTLGPTVGAPGDTVPDDIDVPETPDALRRRLESDGWIVLRKTKEWEDKIQIVEAKGESHKFISEELKDLVKQMMQTLRQMNMTASANEKSVGRSAASKQVDQHGTSMLLSVYKRRVIDFVIKFMTCLASGRHEDIRFAVEGLSIAEPVLERPTLITEITSLGIDVLKMPAMFKNKLLFNYATQLLNNELTDKERLELQEKIEELVDAGEFDAIDEAEATAAGNKMAKTTAASAGSQDPKDPTNAQLPTGQADVDPKTMHDRSVSTAGVANTVMEQLKPDYDKKLLQWIPAAHWIQLDVPLTSIDDSNRDNWAASQHPDKVDDMAEAMKDGWEKPVILVNEPNANKMKLVDGHHRFLAAEQAGKKTVKAFVAYVGGIDGQWKDMHDLQKEGDNGGKSQQSNQKSNQK